MPDLFQTQQDILAQARAVQAFPVYTGGIEEAQTLAATNGELLPHIVLRFGSPQPYLADASFGGPRYDGKYSAVDAMCIGASDTDARRIASAFGDLMEGFKPNGDAGSLSYGWGGGTFTVISESSRPQFYIAWVPFRFNYNLAPVG